MKYRLFFLTFLILAVLGLFSYRLACAQTPSVASPRSVMNFDRDWRFHLGDAPGSEQASADDSSWRKLSLPHDYSIEGPPNPDGKGQMEGPFDKNSPAGNAGACLNAGIAWYRKTFTVPASAQGQQISILFDGAYNCAEVWVNGHDLGFHPYGFTSFSYDLTPYLKFGDKNVLAVKLNVQQPGCRWYSGAGLFRHLWLIQTAPVHLTQWGTYITTPAPTGLDLTQTSNWPTAAEVQVETKVSNDTATEAKAELTTRVIDPSGREVGRQVSVQAVAATGFSTFPQKVSVAQPQWWSLETPVLYHLISEVRINGQLTDVTVNPFGIRYFTFTKDKGFFLNGKHVPIQGVCDHADLGALGSAAYRRALERQIEVLKSFGCNAIRTSHNPPSPELLELCDEKGMVVMDEAFDEWKQNHHKYGYADYFDQWSEPDMVSMLDRDRNHPSIVLWSIGNEIPEGREGKPEAGPRAQRLAGFCHREDPSRPVTSACPSPGNDWKCGLAQALDVFGINYSTGWYGKNDPKTSAPIKPDDAGYYGQRPLVGSETSSQVDSRCEYGLKLDAQGNVTIDAKPGFQVSSYDTSHPGWGYSAEDDLLALKHNPWVAGEFVWTGFDYLGEPTPFPWPARSSYFGIVDLCGFPKDRYYIYQSQWTTTPMVHILPMSWNWPGFEGKTIPVEVFSNAESVELFLNGKSLGVKNIPGDYGNQTQEHQDRTTKAITLVKSPGLHLDWAVPYAPGELKAVASKGGQIVATDIVRTAGLPAKMVLSADRTQIEGSGQDLSYIKVSLVDKDGTVCPNAENELTFSVNGSAATIAGLDNGDATNHESFQGTQHKAWHGLALAILKSAEDASGSVTLTVKSEGLPDATITINVVPQTVAAGELPLPPASTTD